ncbi:trascription factor [Aspergillus piperis CBS 112811]|uniref:Trascription factor n=1 Tax=Aspergillus piperis CBS 112811 TaxID=1448313 RepID=A0A8G1R6C7_9EURO|nr:trascription factor [Aspergillus piperis CBS 112811]RAH58515.1 trascription factor [Aspergillus piperis CBS 112811]
MGRSAMHPTGRKRRVTTCVPCYTKKQRCNRQYPCNYCTRRRPPEECVYQSTIAEPSNNSPRESIRGLEPREPASIELPEGLAEILPSEAQKGSSNPHSSLANPFGYFEHSDSNTMALLKKWDLDSRDQDENTEGMSTTVLETVKEYFDRMPPRPILDFLMQYFWAKKWPISVEEIEFAALILRIGAYSAHFLLSPTHTSDRVHGQPLSEVRNTCSDIGDELARACLALDWKGSLVRVQHVLFASLKFSCEGRTDKFWEGIASACSAAQKAGIHTVAPVPGEDSSQVLEKEMRRRTLCGLYVLDSHLARQLDRVPILPDNLVLETLPRLRLAPDIIDLSTPADTPEIFTERLMQVRLGMFWRSLGSKRNLPYDPIHGEERYERFCADYIPTLPPEFALNPNRRWDVQLPKLPMQRQLLYIAIFDSVCWNFRPLLLLQPSQVTSLPPYKQVLLRSQKHRLALAALEELHAVTTLHTMFGGSHTRFSAIIFNTFEAAVVLLVLCAHKDFPFDQGESHVNILGLRMATLTRARTMRAVEKALGRLQMLARVSEMAASGAQVVTQLFAKAARLEQLQEPGTTTESNQSSLSPRISSNFPNVDSGSGLWMPPGEWNLTSMPDMVSTIGYGDSYSILQFPSLDPTCWDSNFHN